MGAILGSHILLLFLHDSGDLRGAAGIGATGLHKDVSAEQVETHWGDGNIAMCYFCAGVGDRSYNNHGAGVGCVWCCC